MRLRNSTIYRTLLVLAGVFAPQCAYSQQLPAQYYQWLVQGADRVQARLDAEPAAGLAAIEQTEGWQHFPHAVLIPAVLYAKQHPANPRYGDPKMLSLALRIGDFLVAEDEKGVYTNRLDYYWDSYMWLEGYRLLESKLGAERKAKWRAALTRHVSMVFDEARAWRDFPRFSAAYIGTSTNHLALWSINLYLGGKLLNRPEWTDAGAYILRRLVTTEQAPDGYWGEHSPRGPTNGYNLLTLAAVGVYYEHSKDKDALAAIQRATVFHANYTWPDGQPVELLNDRNRHWGAKIYSNFPFSHSPDGRALAQVIARSYSDADLTIETLGRVAQNTLYYHDGPAPTPLQHRATYHHQLSIPAGIRKDGPWLWCLAGITATRPMLSQWFLDRQSVVSVYHEKLGLIISGANSKNQPELASFRETAGNTQYHLPLDGRLTLNPNGDRLSVAYNRFFVDIVAKRISDNEMELQYRFTAKGSQPDGAVMTLQLMLHPGEELRVADAAPVKIGTDPVALDASQLRQGLSHAGWTITSDSDMSLKWPVYTYSPYTARVVQRIESAVATLDFPLRFRDIRRPYIRPDEVTITVRIKTP